MVHESKLLSHSFFVVCKTRRKLNNGGGEEDRAGRQLDPGGVGKLESDVGKEDFFFLKK